MSVYKYAETCCFSLPHSCHHQNSARVVFRLKVPQVTSAERMEVMQRLHSFLLRQSKSTDSTPAEQGQAVESTNASDDKDIQQQEPEHNTRSPQANVVAASQTAQPPRASEAFPAIHAFMRLLDKLIVLVLLLLAVLIVSNVFLHS